MLVGAKTGMNHAEKETGVTALLAAVLSFRDGSDGNGVWCRSGAPSQTARTHVRRWVSACHCAVVLV